MNETDYCSFCGSSVESGTQFCQNCGASLTKTVETTPTYITQVVVTSDYEVYQQPATVYVPQDQEKADTLGIVSLILGISGFCLIPLLSIPAVITGHIARNKTKSQMGLIGLILGYFGIAYLVGVILYLSFIFWWW